MTTYWRKNHGTEQPSLLAFASVASYNLDANESVEFGARRLRQWALTLIRWRNGSASTVQKASGSKCEQFWDELTGHCQPKSVLWLFGFDALESLWLLEFPERIESGDIHLTIRGRRQGEDGKLCHANERSWRGLCSIDRGAVIIHAVRNGLRFNVVDVANYFRGGCESVASSLGVVLPIRPRRHDGDEKHAEYLAEVNGVAESAITSLMTEWKASDMGNWQPTVPSLAHSAYRHRFMPVGIACHNDPQASSMEHDAYLDGRVQAFFVGDIRDRNSGGSVFGSECVQSNRPWMDGPIHHLDANSLYPSVMAVNKFPFAAVCNGDGQPIVHASESVESLASATFCYLAVASVRLDTDKDWYPVRRNGETVYPVGSFHATLCTPELRLALDNGHVTGVNWVIYYRGAGLFMDWVGYWIGRRDFHRANDNHSAAAVCKLAVNSLCGKLAQRERFWVNSESVQPAEPWQSWIEHDADSGATTKCRSIGWTAQTMNDSGFARHALVAVSAHVNSYARVAMINMRLCCGAKNVYYQANDGLIVSDAGLLELQAAGYVHETELGKLRLVGSYETARFFGPRDYEEDGREVKAGLPSNSVRTADRTWTCELGECAASLLARIPDGTVRTVHQKITGSIGGQPGTYLENGWTKPIVLGR